LNLIVVHLSAGSTDKWLIRETAPTEMHKWQNDKDSNVRTFKAEEKLTTFKVARCSERWQDVTKGGKM
jgi:hypothetical protein